MPADDDLVHGLRDLKLDNNGEQRPQSTADSKPRKARRRRDFAPADSQPITPIDTRRHSNRDVQLPADRSSEQTSGSATVTLHRTNDEDTSLKPHASVWTRHRGTDEHTSSLESKLPTNGDKRSKRRPISYSSPPWGSVRDHVREVTGLSNVGEASHSASPPQGTVTRPTPSESYLDLANQEPVQHEKERAPLLVVLDLNGTLLYRSKAQKGGSNATHRTGTKDFLRYLGDEHFIVVWSSAQPVNVMNMCKKLFTNEISKRRLGVLTRKDLGLLPSDYVRKVQVYKQLSKIWRDPVMSRGKHHGKWIQFDQTNTVLLDDSREKAASEPFNLVEIETFMGNGETNQDTLLQVRDYLETLRSYTNVSAYIRENPYTHDPERKWDFVTPGYLEALSASGGVDKENGTSKVSDDPPLDPGAAVDHEALESEPDVSPAPGLPAEQTSKEEEVSSLSPSLAFEQLSIKKEDSCPPPSG